MGAENHLERPTDGEPFRKFAANNGRASGWAALVVGLASIVFLVADGLSRADALPIAVVGLAMALVWTLMLRPGLSFVGNDLVLRQSFSDVIVPLVLVESVTIRLFMVVATSERILRSSAFSRSRGELVKRDRGRVVVDPIRDYTDLVEHQITHYAQDARDRNAPAGPITRSPAWLEIVLVGLLSVAVVVLVVL